MTECPQPITFLGPEDHLIEGRPEKLRRLSSAGRPAMGVEVRIVGEDGRPVKPGEVGEIMLRSDKLMKEYWKLPQETAEAFDDGWFHTRDMGALDEEGYIYIVDRKSDMIISGGFNIYPREVEEVIMAHPGVAEAGGGSVAAEILGGGGKAGGGLYARGAVGEEEIIQFCKKNLASYKKPRSVDFAAEIPKNLYGKIDRRALREPYWTGHDRRVH